VDDINLLLFIIIITIIIKLVVGNSLHYMSPLMYSQNLISLYLVAFLATYIHNNTLHFNEQYLTFIDKM
jgi:hypothetical protein